MLFILITIYLLSVFTGVIIIFRDTYFLDLDIFFCFLLPGVNTIAAIVVLVMLFSEHVEEKKSKKSKIQEQHSNGIFEVVIDGKKYEISDKEF